MLRTLKKFFAFCGVDNRRLFMASIWLGVVSAICSAMRIPAAAIVIQALLERNVTMATLWTSLGIIVISLIITIAINMKATMLQTIGGYRACANKRIEIAEHLRYLPMGWFNDNSLGEVTSVTTNTMENMANIATRVVMVTTRGFLTSGIIAAMMFLFDWRMGLITLAGLVLFFAVNAAMQRAEQTLSQRKFNADERLVSKVLEYVQGIAEVKNFDLTHDSATQVHGAVEEARRASFAMEIPSVLYMLAQFVVNKLTGVAVCAAAIVFYFSGTMELTNCLLMLICSFILFEQLGGQPQAVYGIHLAGRGQRHLLRYAYSGSRHRHSGAAGKERHYGNFMDEPRHYRDLIDHYDCHQHEGHHAANHRRLPSLRQQAD